ncbi:uncharacterized protein DUF4271 [Tenacibaculum adriaticum]|uniref:Uncharacterized protein DUF4271 n=1 Tax=Tenacibaculum adriaticum TaxID=413713 RepID=A0A5S5DVF5_9FLAO|nr:uncharacterized protein DUF4271 [Tenacibaculum adriaticum]
MEAIERNFLSDDLITITFLLGFVLLFLMKLYKPQRLLGYSIAFFTQGFIEKRSEETTSLLSPFHGVMFTFSVIIISLTFFTLITSFTLEKNLFLFLLILGVTAFYFIAKYLISYLIINVFSMQEDLNYFLYSKNGYLYSICLWIFPVLIINQYWFKDIFFLLFFITLLLVFRVYLILTNNKRMIFNQFFYFILYFCTLELAPLLILYKTITI